MPCPHCAAATTNELTKHTQLGYRTFRCAACRRQFNERTGTPYNDLAFPTDSVLVVVLWRLRSKLSLRDLAAMFLARGVVFTHEAVRDWEARFAPRLTEQLRATRKHQAGRSGPVAETSIKVHGRWHYLYRAIDQDGTLGDSLLSPKREMAAAKRFVGQARAVAANTAERVITEGHAASPRAMRELLGEEVRHRWSPYLTNGIEQDQRGINQRYSPMRGFNSGASAACFCRACDEQRQYFRLRTRMGQRLPALLEQRREFRARWTALMAELMAA